MKNIMSFLEMITELFNKTYQEFFFQSDHSFRVNTFRGDCLNKFKQYDDMKTKFVQDIKKLLDEIMKEYGTLKDAMKKANEVTNWIIKQN